MPEYASVIAPARRVFEASEGTQPGDPLRGAEAIVTAAELDRPPLRLPLGVEAFGWLRSYLENRLDELGEVEPLGADTAYS